MDEALTKKENGVWEINLAFNEKAKGYSWGYDKNGKKNYNHPGYDMRYMVNGKNKTIGAELPSLTAGNILSINRDATKATGNMIEIEYDGGRLQYQHLGSIPTSLKVGMEVAKGDIIGIGGNTGKSSGPHVHVAHKFYSDPGPNIDKVIVDWNNNGKFRYFTNPPKY